MRYLPTFLLLFAYLAGGTYAQEEQAKDFVEAPIVVEQTDHLKDIPKIKYRPTISGEGPKKDDDIEAKPTVKRVLPPLGTKQVAVKAKWNEVREAIRSKRVMDTKTMALAARRAEGKTAFSRKFSEFQSRARKLDTPVLLPVTATNAKKIELVTRKKTYSFNADYDDSVYVDVMGMCSGFILPEGHPMAPKANTSERHALKDWNTKGQYLHAHESDANHGVYEVNFNAFGCGYQLTVSCARDCDEAEIAQKIMLEMGVLNEPQ